jgi:hypothetical protein
VNRAARIGISLSGGGFRAASFHLGVLKRLEELRLLENITILSAVSGGSIVGALYALRTSQGEKRAGQFTAGARGYSVDKLIKELCPVLTQNLRGRALLGTQRRAIRTVLSLFWPRASRIGMIADELDRCLYRGATLDELPPWVLLNATNLRTGKAWKFFNDRAGDYIVGATTKTKSIRVADAVAASAAYPVLADAYRFEYQAGELRPELLDKRWGFLGDAAVKAGEAWRARFGTLHGTVIMPLADGGGYDNEGLIGLRSAGVTHAVLSSTAPPENDATVGWWPLQIWRMVEVMHGRLGAGTRQLTHEITHAVNLSAAGRELSDVARELRELSGRMSARGDIVSRDELLVLAARLREQAGVGRPQRGHQFTASAPILLNKTELTTSEFAGYEDRDLDVPEEYRGCCKDIIDELSRVRTDLDALEPEIVDLLIAQGYFLTDAYCKVCMPDLVRDLNGTEDLYGIGLLPQWDPATTRVAVANHDARGIVSRLRSTPLLEHESASRVNRIFDTICGVSDTASEHSDLKARLIIATTPIGVCIAAASFWLMYGVYRGLASIYSLVM